MMTIKSIKNNLDQTIYEVYSGKTYLLWFFTRAEAKAWIQEHESAEDKAATKAKKDRVNANARAKHATMKDLGMKRVRGSMGGTYYE